MTLAFVVPFLFMYCILISRRRATELSICMGPPFSAKRLLSVSHRIPVRIPITMELLSPPASLKRRSYLGPQTLQRKQWNNGALCACSFDVPTVTQRLRPNQIFADKNRGWLQNRKNRERLVHEYFERIR